MSDLGNLGEAVLQQWATQAQLILNSSKNHDAAGWDCLVEWPLVGPGESRVGDEVPVTLPLDRRPGPLQCFVQVKTTARRISRWEVKLSNWLRFVRAPLPYFFVVVEVDADRMPQRAFVVHVGPEYVRDVLKKVRELEARASGRDGPVQLHKHHLPVRWTDDDALP